MPLGLTCPSWPTATFSAKDRDTRCALVNEAYLKLAGQRTEWRDKSKFLAVAARAMRHILVDHARSQSRQKRGLRPKKVTLNEIVAIAETDWPDLLDLDHALHR